MPLITTKAFPGTFARQGLAARERLVQGFITYFREGYHQHASLAFHARLNHSLQSGFSEEDIARGEIGACLALINNAVPGAFWLLYHIFSDPKVHAACKEEVIKATHVEGSVHTIDLSYLRNSCPILHSTFQEILRGRGTGTLMIRRVLEDHLLNKSYLLKKGSILLIPNAVQHVKSDVWGSQADSFQHDRFTGKGTNGLKRYNTTAFRPFGSGSTLCPGRHLAITELLAFAALAIATVDIVPTGGRWDSIQTGKSFGLGVARIFLLPDNDIEVSIRSKGDQVWKLGGAKNSHET